MRVSSLSLLVLLSLVGCDKSEPKEDTKPADAEVAAPKPALDPGLAEAVAAASAAPPAGAKGAPGTQVDGGPPLDGVFAPGGADKEAPRGSLPKITLGSDGSEPRVKLGPSAPSRKLAGSVQVAMQADPRQGAIPVLLDVVIEPKKGTEAVPADKPVSLPVSVRVTGAKIDAPGAPPELNERIAKLKGSKLEYNIVPGGAGAGFRFDVPKGVPEDLRDVVRSLSDALALLTVPYPEKPLGAGAYFMVTSRDELMGLDLVSYRLVKVKQVTPEGATLEVSTKRYAASRTFDFPGLPPDIERNLTEFQATSDAVVELQAGALLPSKGQISSVLLAQLGSPDARQRPLLQLQTRTQLNLK
jgi:hypothetical protein